MTIDVPAVRLEVQDGPVRLEEALAGAVDGRYAGVVEVPLHALMARQAGPRVLEAFLARQLVQDGYAVDVRHRVVAVGPCGRVVFVEVSLDVRTLALATV